MGCLLLENYCKTKAYRPEYEPESPASVLR
jgi:hypothetical protein